MLYSTADTNPKSNHHSDEELVALYIQTWQNYYFGLLYIRYSERVYRQCLFLVKDHGLAQDLTHDIFLKLAVGLVSFKGKSRFSSWLSRVTHNHCMDHFNLCTRRAEIPIDGKTEIADDIDLINFLDDDSNQLMHLNSALTNLSSEEKTILRMRYNEDVSIKDIAGVFKINESAVKMRLMRSRNKLRPSCSAYYFKY